MTLRSLLWICFQNVSLSQQPASSAACQSQRMFYITALRPRKQQNIRPDRLLLNIALQVLFGLNCVRFVLFDRYTH